MTSINDDDDDVRSESYKDAVEGISDLKTEINKCNYSDAGQIAANLEYARYLFSLLSNAERAEFFEEFAEDLYQIEIDLAQDSPWPENFEFDNEGIMACDSHGNYFYFESLGGMVKWYHDHPGFSLGYVENYED